jgi:2-dehydropantoate 2-reductase
MPSRAGPDSPAMKVCVFGAGAIGGLLAARLADTGCELSIVARGPHLRALQENGLTLLSGGRTTNHPIRATDRCADLGVQDCVILATKAHSVEAALPELVSLVGPGTVVIPAMNGLPWWFFEGADPRLAEGGPANTDPSGLISAAIPLAQVLGCVVYLTAFVPAPGVINHTGRLEMHLGEPDGGDTPRLAQMQALLAHAGFACEPTSEIRREIWIKLMGNATFSPLSALTRAPLDRLLGDPLIVELVDMAMREVIAVGMEMGLAPKGSPAQRIEKTRLLGSVKISMLQDIEQGRPLEYEALTGAVVDVAARLGVRVPTLRAIHGLIRQRAASLNSTGD